MVIDSWRLQRRWRRLQRPVAAACIATGGFLIWAHNNAPPATVPTVVSTSDVPAGGLVSSTDLQVVGWPADSRPAPAASSVEAIVGRRASAPIRAGEPLTELRVVGQSLLAEVGPDRVAIALAEDSLAGSGLIRPGDLVNLVGQTDAGPRTLVTAAQVLTLHDPTGAVLAVPASAAAAVVEAAATDSIAMVLLSAQP